MGFIERYVALILSYHKIGALIREMPRSQMTVWSHVISAVDEVSDLYSAFVVERTTVFLFLQAVWDEMIF